MLIVGHTLPGEVKFQGTDIGRVTLRNGSGQVPGTFKFKNTGLSCSDITVESKKSGTKIFINGQLCNL